MNHNSNQLLLTVTANDWLSYLKQRCGRNSEIIVSKLFILTHVTDVIFSFVSNITW